MTFMTFRAITLFLLLFICTNANAQVQGKITLAEDNQTYLVSIIPSASYAFPLNITNNAQISFRAPTGSYTPESFMNITGFWIPSSVVTSPIESPEYEYFSFILGAPLSDANYINGEEMLLFSFVNANQDCQGGIAILNNDNDPFLPPNSQDINVGNYFSILGAGIGNAYAGNINEEGASCPEPLSIEIDNSVTTVSCPGETTTLTVFCAGGAAPFTLVYEDVVSGNSETISINEIGGSAIFENVLAGEYNLLLTDSLSQSVSEVVEILEPTPLSLQLVGEESTCDNSPDGMASVQLVSGGTVNGGYQYAWSNGSQADLAEDLLVGWYYLTVSDDNGCSIIDSLLIESESNFAIEAFGTDAICNGENSGSATVNILNGEGPFTFAWQGDSMNETTEIIEDLPAGMYTVLVLDGTGVCGATDTVTINEPLELNLSAETDVASCDLVTTGDININEVENGVAPFMFSIDEGDFTTEVNYTMAVGEEYNLTVEDADGCQAEITVFLPQPEPLHVELSGEEKIELGDMVTLEAIYSPIDNDLTFDWRIAEMESCDTCSVMQFQPIESSLYFVTVRDTFGCEANAKITIIVEKNEDVFIPTAFSPNGDGRNDSFTLYPGESVASLTNLAIFNRWGVQVFFSEEINNNPDTGWDGLYRGQKSQTGLYVYEAEVVYIDGHREVLRGEINLME